MRRNRTLRIWMATLIALPALALLGADTASAAGSAIGGTTIGSGGGLGLSPNECKAYGGDFDDHGDGSWSCCFGDQCWNCEGYAPAVPPEEHCYCLGEGCSDVPSGLGQGTSIFGGPKPGGLKHDRNTSTTQPKASERPRRVKRLSEAERLELREKRAEQRELRDRRSERSKGLSREERLERRKLRAERLRDRQASELTDAERLELREKRRDRRDRSRRDLRSK